MDGLETETIPRTSKDLLELETVKPIPDCLLISQKDKQQQPKPTKPDFNFVSCSSSLLSRTKQFLEQIDSLQESDSQIQGDCDIVVSESDEEQAVTETEEEDQESDQENSLESDISLEPEKQVQLSFLILPKNEEFDKISSVLESEDGGQDE